MTKLRSFALALAALALAPQAHAISCTSGGVFTADLETVGGTDIDLRTANATSTFNAGGNTAIVTQVAPQSTGTGVIDPFLRVQRANSPCVAGYNTGGNANLTLDDIAGLHTHALATSSLTTVDVGGTRYVQFLLDINQTGADPLLSLEAFRLFSFGDGNLDGIAGRDALLGGALGVTSLFNMDDGENRRLLMNFGLNSGSGSGDVLFLINESVFANAGSFIYLWSRFGAAGTPFENNDGFEEWATVAGDCPIFENCSEVPEPGSLALLGLGLLGLGVMRRKAQVEG